MTTVATLAASLQALFTATADPRKPFVPPPTEAVAPFLNFAPLLNAVETASQAATRVLVVDDDGRLAEITARGLRRLGYEAESRTSFRTLGPGEVLVFDLGLLQGLDAAARHSVRAARPIVVTGATDPGSHALASSVDASDYLVKPIELEELAEAIKRRTAEA